MGGDDTLNNKFELSTFIDINNKSFIEYLDVQEFIVNEGESSLDGYYGYFDPRTNVLQGELSKENPETSWFICYIDLDGVHRLKIYESTLKLNIDLPTVISNCESSDYVNIYRKREIILL